MFIPKKSDIFNVIALAVVATPLALAANSVNDHYFPKDVLVCKDGSREAHIYGSYGIGWISGKTLALVHKDAAGNNIYDGVKSLHLTDLKETAKAKMAEARKVAQEYCRTGNTKLIAQIP